MNEVILVELNALCSDGGARWHRNRNTVRLVRERKPPKRVLAANHSDMRRGKRYTGKVLTR